MSESRFLPGKSVYIKFFSPLIIFLMTFFAIALSGCESDAPKKEISAEEAAKAEEADDSFAVFENIVPEPAAEVLTLIPYQSEVEHYRQRIRNGENYAELWLEIAALRVAQAEESKDDVRMWLLQEALKALEVANAATPGRLFREQSTVEAAMIKALIATMLPEEKRQKVLNQAKRLYLRADDQKVLASVESYTPGIGWVMSLAYLARDQKGPNAGNAQKILMDEALKLSRDDSFIKAKKPSQKIFLADALILFAGCITEKKQTEQILDQALAIIDAAVKAITKEEEEYFGHDKPALRADLLRAVIWLAKAEAALGEERDKRLGTALETMSKYIGDFGYYAGYESEQFAKERAGLIWETADATLQDHPYYWAMKGLWAYAFSENNKSAAKEYLDKAVAMAPDSAPVLKAYVIAAGKDSYGDVFGKDILPVYERLACLEKDDVTGWTRWGAAASSPLSYAGDEHSKVAGEMTARIQTLSDQHDCPAFAAYAGGVAETYRYKEGRRAAIPLFEKAAEFPHSDAQALLIYGMAGENWLNIDKHVLPSRSENPEEHLEAQQKARENFQKAEQAYAKIKDTPAIEIFARKEYGEKKSEFPWKNDYHETLLKLMQNPLAPLTPDLLADARATMYSAQEENQESAANKSYWANLLRSSARDVHYYAKEIPGGADRERELLDLSLDFYKQVNDQAGASPELPQRWAGTMYERAQLDQPGTRLEMLTETVRLYGLALAGVPSGENYKGMAEARLLLAGEQNADEAAATLALAFSDFCKAAGLPETSPRARQAWRDILLGASETAPEAGKEAFRSEARKFAPDNG